jgi:phage recombination protein Bet
MSNEMTEFKAALTKRDIDEFALNALRTSIFPGASDNSILLAWDYCKSRGLDIMKKPCHIVPMSVKDSKSGRYEWRDIIMPGISEHRITASRTKCYAGVDEAKLGENIEVNIGGEKLTVPEYATVTVYRIVDRERVAFSHTEWFEEACATTKEGKVNSMWKKRRRGQLIKCAEAGALRKAFPEELGGMHTAEEMEGRTIDMGQAEVVIEEESVTAGASGVAEKLKNAKPPAEKPKATKKEGDIIDAEFTEEKKKPDDKWVESYEKEATKPTEAAPPEEAAETEKVPISENKMKVIRSTMAKNGVTEEQLFAELGITSFDDIDGNDMSMINKCITLAKGS